MADEKNTRLSGERIYIATTVAGGCFVGAEISEQADTESLTDAYGVFQQEAIALDADYAPKTVTTDGWLATDAAFKALFPQITILLCFLHAFLKLRRRAKRLFQDWTILRKKLWGAYRAQKRAAFSQRLRRTNEWVQQHICIDSVREVMSRIAANVARYSQAYQHPAATRTTNMVDRLINYQEHILQDMQLFHGTKQSANLAGRAMALLWNLHPYGSRTRSSVHDRVSPFVDLNGFQYHDNWLENLLIAASRAGNSP